MALSLRIGKSVFVYFNPALPKIYLQLGLSACFLIGPALYYFIQSGLKQITDFPRSWKIQIASLVGIIPLMGILSRSGVYPEHWNHFHFDLRERNGGRRYCD